MPYKGWESYKIEEDCIREWARDLKPTTARTYVYYFLKYLGWVKKKGYWSTAKEMIEDCKNGNRERQYKHLDVFLEYIKSLSTGIKDKRNRYMAVKSFYEYHRADLPKPSKVEINRAFSPSELDKKRAIVLSRPLTIEEVKRIIVHAPQPYKAAFMVCFQGALGQSEYNQFNEFVWKSVIDQLDSDEPIKINLIREKISRQDIKDYYSFIGKDGKELIRDWLKEKLEWKEGLKEELRRAFEEVEEKYLFIVFNRVKRKYVPLTGRLLSNMLTKIAKRLELIKENGVNRYHIHLHEFRDLFKSICTLRGVHVVASEFFLGHVIDKLGYDKSPKYDEEFFKNEYKKIEGDLNVITGFTTVKEVKEDVLDLQKENEELKKRLQDLETKIAILFQQFEKEPDKTTDLIRKTIEENIQD